MFYYQILLTKYIRNNKETKDNIGSKKLVQLLTSHVEAFIDSTICKEVVHPNLTIGINNEKLTPTFVP